MIHAHERSVNKVIWNLCKKSG